MIRGNKKIGIKKERSYSKKEYKSMRKKAKLLTKDMKDSSFDDKEYEIEMNKAIDKFGMFLATSRTKSNGQHFRKIKKKLIQFHKDFKDLEPLVKKKK